MGNYYPSASQEAALVGIRADLARGLAPMPVLCTGEPGSGKSAFARWIASELKADFFIFRVGAAPARELAFKVDVAGVVTRTRGYVAGPALQAIRAAKDGRTVVLLVDEVDKGDDALFTILLPLLDEQEATNELGSQEVAPPGRMVIVATANTEVRGRCKDALLRRTQRMPVAMPTGDRLAAIIRQEAGVEVPPGLVALLVRLGALVRRNNGAAAPSPKELGVLARRLLDLGGSGLKEQAVWRETAAGLLWKSQAGASAAMDKAVKATGRAWNWVAALQTECRRAQV